MCSYFLRTEIFPPGGRHKRLVKSMRLTGFIDPLLKALKAVTTVRENRFSDKLNYKQVEQPALEV